jgi:hypothetical protein
MLDEDRLKQVGDLFADELQIYGLRRVRSLRRLSKSGTEVGG